MANGGGHLFTVEEVAEKLSISKVTVYAKLKKYNNEVVIKQGKKYVSEDLFNLIKKDLKVKNNLKIEKDRSDVNQEISMDIDDLINLNKSLNESLVKQLEEKDRQISELHKKIDELINLNKNNQVLLKQQQDKEIHQLQLEEHFKEVDEKLSDLREKLNNEKEEKKSFFKFFRK